MALTVVMYPFSHGSIFLPSPLPSSLHGSQTWRLSIRHIGIVASVHEVCHPSLRIPLSHRPELVHGVSQGGAGEAGWLKWQQGDDGGRKEKKETAVDFSEFRELTHHHHVTNGVIIMMSSGWRTESLDQNCQNPNLDYVAQRWPTKICWMKDCDS